MGKIDIITKEYMENPVVFADAFNQFLYHGEQKIDPPTDGAGHNGNRGSIRCQRCQRAGTEIQGCAETPICHDGRQDGILCHGNRKPGGNPLCPSGQERRL